MELANHAQAGHRALIQMKSHKSALLGLIHKAANLNVHHAQKINGRHYQDRRLVINAIKGTTAMTLQLVQLLYLEELEMSIAPMTLSLYHNIIVRKI